MKKLEIVIRVERLDAVKAALESRGYPGMMLTRIEGHGKQKGVVQQFRGREYRLEMLPKYKIEIVVRDEDVRKLADAIVSAARTGEAGDGKIFVYPVEEVIRIRTGETGEIAV